MQLLQHRHRRAHVAVPAAVHEDLVAAGDEAHRQALFDAREIDVVVAEKKGAGSVVFEADALACFGELCDRRDRGQWRISPVVSCCGSRDGPPDCAHAPR